MDVVGRLLLRLLLIPLGYFIATIVGTLVIVVGAWHLGDAPPDEEGFVLLGLVLAAPFLLLHLLYVMWMPAAIGILLAEAFAVRSWLFHAGNGAVTAWIGRAVFGYIDVSRTPIDGPVTVIAAGIAGGLAYWAVAGRNAGPWLPASAPDSSVG
jgi:hypothetical protein